MATVHRMQHHAHQKLTLSARATPCSTQCDACSPVARSASKTSPAPSAPRRACRREQCELTARTYCYPGVHWASQKLSAKLQLSCLPLHWCCVCWWKKETCSIFHAHGAIWLLQTSCNTPGKTHSKSRAEVNSQCFEKLHFTAAVHAHVQWVCCHHRKEPPEQRGAHVL